jgi:hypothetical protein
MYIYPLSRIHKRSLVSAYFKLDKRECECLEYYLFIILFNFQTNIQSQLHFHQVFFLCQISSELI